MTDGRKSRDKARQGYDPEEYWDKKARSAADPSAAVRHGDPFFDRCIERSQRAVIQRALRQLATYSTEQSKPLKIEDMSILDFGCGTGQWTEPLSCRFKNYAGVDISNAMLETARSRYPADRYPNVDFRQVRKQHIPFEDNSFDVAFSLAVVHHNNYDEQAALLKELCRVLRPNGWLLAFEGVGERSRDDESHFYFRPIEDWKQFFQQNDLRVVWRANCRYALLWYLYERIEDRLFRDGGRGPVPRQKRKLRDTLRRFVLKLDQFMAPTFLRCTPERLAGRCAMLLQRK